MIGAVKVLGLFIFDKQTHIPEIEINTKSLAEEALTRGDIHDSIVMGIDFSVRHGFSTSCYTRLAPILAHYGASMTRDKEYRLVFYLDAHGYPSLVTSCSTDWETEDPDNNWDGTFSGVYTPVRMLLQVVECLVRTLCPRMTWVNVHLSSCQIVTPLPTIDDKGRKKV